MTQRTLSSRIATPAGMVSAVGTAVALCIMGDSLMYSILPLYAGSAGIALPLVGILLSANRFIRLLSNRWAGSAFERYGAKFPFVLSVILGLLSTVAYGLATGFLVFLLARLAWGVAWSGLRQGGYVATWTGRPDIRGGLTGLLLGLIRMGSAVGVILGGFLFDRYGFVTSVGAVAAIGILAVPLAFIIPWQQTDPARIQQPADSSKPSSDSWREFARIAFAQATHRWLSISSFFVYMLGGVIVSTTSLFIAARVAQTVETGSDGLALGIGVATLTGLLHGARWVTNLIVAPVVGALSDRFGKSNTLLILAVLMVGSLLAVALSPPAYAVLALLFVLLLDGSLHVVVNATATTVATDTERPHTFIAAFATLSDAGSAFGPLIAFSALATTRLPTVYLAGGAVVLLSILMYWRSERQSSPTIWK